MFSLLNLVLLLVLIQDVQPLQIKIGGLFTGIEPPTNNGIARLRGAQLAIKALNNKEAQNTNHTFQLLPLEDKGAGWHGLRAMCNLTNIGVHSVIGPAYSSTSVTVAKFCSAYHIPCISYSATSATLSDRNAYPYFARVVAPDTMQASAIAKIVNKFEWKNICILHRDDNYGIQGALATVANAKLNGINVISMKSYNHKTSDAASVTESLVQDGCRIFIAWCIKCDVMMKSIYINHPEILTNVENSPPKYAWIMSDGCNGNTGEYSKTNGLGQAVVGSFCISPSTPDGPTRTSFDNSWHAEYGNLNDGVTATRYALFAYDAVLAATHSILAEISSTNTNNNNTFELFKLGDNDGDQCLQNPMETQKYWSNGANVLNGLHNVNFVGATSGINKLELSQTNERISAQYSISNIQGIQLANTAVDMFTPIVVGEANVTSNGGAKVAFQRPIQWSSDTTYYATKPSDVFEISSRRYKVITFAGARPFADLVEGKTLCQNCPRYYTNTSMVIYKCPNSCYWGLAFDVMDYLRSPSNLNFEYDIYHVPAGSSYTGTIFDSLLKHDFDMAVGDITATSSRAEKVETSYAYYDLGLQLVMMKNDKAAAGDMDIGLMFLAFKPDTWIFIFVFYITTASILFYIFEHGINSDVPALVFGNKKCLSKLLKNNKTGAHKKKKEKRKRKSIIENKESQSGLFNSMYWGWTSFALSMDITPVTTAGKTFAVGFILCNVLLLSIYTSVMASYLTVKRIPIPTFTGIDEIGQGSVQYRDVCLATAGGSIQMFYDLKFPKPHQRCFNCDQPGATYQGCYDLMQEGKVKVIIGDSPVLRYYVQNTWCDAELVGKLFYLQGFSFMGRKESNLIRGLTEAILKMKEHQELERLDQKYFEDQQDCPATSETSETATDGLTIHELAPLWIIFGIFSIISLCIFIWEQRHGLKEAPTKLKMKSVVSKIMQKNKDKKMAMKEKNDDNVNDNDQEKTKEEREKQFELSIMEGTNDDGDGTTDITTTTNTNEGDEGKTMI